MFGCMIYLAREYWRVVGSSGVHFWTCSILSKMLGRWIFLSWVYKSGIEKRCFDLKI